MFGPVLLPVSLTFLVMLSMFTALPFLLRRFTKTKGAVSLAFGICVAASIPTLFLVGAIVDSVRYGEFTYSSPDEIGGYTFWTLPSDATLITMHKYSSGHELRFHTTQIALEKWMDQIRARQLELYENVEEFVLIDHADQEWFDSCFSRHEWPFPDDAVMYRGPRGEKGSGFETWFSKKNQTAYISRNYW